MENMDHMSKHLCCVHHVFGCSKEELGKHYCAPHAKTLGEQWEQKEPLDISKCETCPMFKSRYIQFPITVKEIEVKEPEVWNAQLAPCSVRLAGDDDKKTYFGIYLGELPWMTGIGFNEKEGKLKIHTTTNPGIFIPELGKVVYGAECWWKRGDNFTEITDDLIGNQWYMRLLNSMASAIEDEREDGEYNEK